MSKIELDHESVLEWMLEFPDEAAAELIYLRDRVATQDEPTDGPAGVKRPHWMPMHWRTDGPGLYWRDDGVTVTPENYFWRVCVPGGRGEKHLHDKEVQEVLAWVDRYIERQSNKQPRVPEIIRKLPDQWDSDPSFDPDKQRKRCARNLRLAIAQVESTKHGEPPAQYTPSGGIGSDQLKDRIVALEQGVRYHIEWMESAEAYNRKSADECAISSDIAFYWRGMASAQESCARSLRDMLDHPAPDGEDDHE